MEVKGRSIYLEALLHLFVVFNPNWIHDGLNDGSSEKQSLLCPVLSWTIRTISLVDASHISYTLNKHRHISYLMKGFLSYLFLLWFEVCSLVCLVKTLEVLNKTNYSTMEMWDLKNLEIYLSSILWLSVNF